jgi:hypothetical protein
LVLVTLAFEPVIGNVAEGQVNLVLLALSGIWFSAWIEGRWWGGLALGAAIALKLIQGPLAVLVLWARRWAMFGAAAAAGLALWLIGAPQYLFEYLFKVLPSVSGGTGFFENHSPGGTITRLVDPQTFFAVPGSPVSARIFTAAISVAILVVTLMWLGRPATTRTGLALEAATVVAATPLIASYSWGTHLVLLLLPMYVLIVWAMPRHDWQVLGLVAGMWLLIGPGHKLLQALLVTGYSNVGVLRVMAEFGVVGLLALWAACLLALRRSADRLDSTDQHGAEEEEDDRAREHDPVAPVAVRSVQGVDQGPAEERDHRLGQSQRDVKKPHVLG